MLVVALIALALGAVRLWSWVQLRRARAWRHELDAVQWRQVADWSAQRRVTVRRNSIGRRALENMGYDARRPYYYYWENDNYYGPTCRGPSQEEYRDELTAICRERAH